MEFTARETASYARYLLSGFFVALLLLAASAQAGPPDHAGRGGGHQAVPPPQDSCELYPFALREEVVTGATPGDVIQQVPRVTGPGGFSWLSWNGSSSTPYLAAGLISPGNAHTYQHPDNPESELVAGSWVYGSPGNKNAKALRDATDNLLGREILVPVWHDISGAGANLQYLVHRFVRIRLTDYRFSGQGWISFEYLGKGQCGQMNLPPVITSEPPTDAIVGTLYTYQVQAEDPDGDPLIFQLLQSPDGMTIDADSGLISWLPGMEMLGPHEVLLRVSDGQGGEAEQGYLLWVHPPVNRDPVITSTPPDRVLLGETYRYDIQAHDPDGDRISYVLVEGPIGADLSVLFGTLRWTPNVDQLGSHDVVVEVRDNRGGSASQSWTVTVDVDPENRPPEILSAPPLAGRVEQLYSYQLIAEDPDGDALHWSLVQAPPGMLLSSDGLLSWVPGSVGRQAVEVRVSDGRGGQDGQLFIIDVDEALVPVVPAITSDPQRHIVGDSRYRYQPTLADENPELLAQWHLASRLPGLSLDGDTGLLSGTSQLETVRGSLLHNDACYAEPGDMSADIEPVLLWHWEGDPAHPSHVNVEHGPVVIPLFDTNDDDVIDANDDPAVIFVSYRGGSNTTNGILQAVSGKDGSLLWRIDDPALRMNPIATPAAGDITGDGRPEILSSLADGGLAMFSNDGQLLWINRTDFGTYGNAPVIADINGDGDVEIVTGLHILDAAGSVQHFYSNISPYSFYDAHLPVVADISGNGVAEVIIGGQVLDYKGAKRTGFHSSTRGFSAVADIMGNGSPEVVYVLAGYVRLFGGDGSLIWSQRIPGSGRGGPPTVADMTGDGSSEIGVAGASTYSVFRADGSVLWSAPIADASSSMTGSTVFDFNGDGRANVVYADHYYLRIFDGPTGEVLFQTPNISWTIKEYPVVADVNNDGQANIVVPANNRVQSGPTGVRVFASGGDPWMPTRTIWNQNAYHIDNINDDLSIPPQPIRFWETHNSFRLNAFSDQRDPLARSDIAIADLRLDGEVIRVDITNRGEAPSRMTGYRLLLDGSEFVAGQVPPLEPGAAHALAIPASEAALAGRVRVSIVLDDDRLDCVHDNNRLDGLLVDLNVRNRFDLSDRQRFVVYRTNGDNTAPVIPNQPPATAERGARFNWTPSVFDRDVGDAHRFSLTEGPPGMEVGEYSGRLRWDVPLDAEGSVTFTLQVTDLAGAVATDSWTLDIVDGDYNAPPYFLSEPPAAGVVGETYHYRALAVDPDGEQLFWQLDEAPEGMTVAADGEVLWSEPVAGEHYIELRVTDDRGAHARQFWILTVAATDAEPGEPQPNQPPRIEADLDATVQAGGEFRRDVRFIDPDGEIVQMQLIDAPEGMNFLLLDDSDPSDLAGQIVWPVQAYAAGDYPVLLRITDDGGLTAERQFIVTVIAQDAAPNLPPLIHSTPATRLYPEDDYQYQVDAEDPEGGPLQYRLDEAPDGMAIDAQGLLAWPGPHIEGQYPITVAVSDELGNVTRQSWALRVDANRPPVFVSTPALGLAAGETYHYDATATDPDGGEVQLALEAGPAGMTLEERQLRWPTTASDAGDHLVHLRATDPRGASTDQAWTLTVQLEANQPPQIVSSPATRVTAGDRYSYQAVGEDLDGDPLTWQLAEGPAAMTLDTDSGLLEWATAEQDIGSHAIELHLLDGRGGIAVQSWTLGVDAQAPDPNNPGPDIHSSAPRQGKVGAQYRYAVDATHPNNLPLTYSLETAPTGASVDSDGLITWTPAEQGEYAFALRVSDGDAWIQQSWTVNVGADEPLALTLDISPWPALINQPVQIILQPAFAAGSISATLQVNGEPVALNEQLVGEFTTATPGQYQISASIDDGLETATAEATVLVHDPDATGGPEVSLLTPAEADEVTAPVDIFGSILGDDILGWRLSWRGVDDTGPGSLIAEGGDEVADNLLGRFDPTLLLNGQYQILLEAWDANGLMDQALRTVQVTGDMKIGHFSLTFEDATIPLAGMPVTLTRTYDSRERHRDMDFGHGWSVGYRNARVQESRIPGLGWALNQYGSGLNVSYCVEPFGSPIVTVALPDGQVERFRARAFPECTPLVPQADVELRFEPLPGTYSSLEQMDFSTVRVTSNNVLVDLSGDPSVPVDPDRYRLTLQDGTELTLDQGFGIRQARELSGNTLTFSDDGISHSSGVGIQFVRDGDNRIERVVLPDGSDLRYTYSNVGDLLAFTDRAGEDTTFTYHQQMPHLLEDILDPRGVRAMRNEYDEDGRLVGQLDADGNRLDFEHDIDGRTQVIRDRSGNATTLVYDERGNVLTETNALGETITRTYDELGNELTRTDALGHLWEYDYDHRGNQIADVDPLGRVTRYDYDTRGQVLGQQAPDGTLVMQNAYHLSTGNLLRTTDALGHETQFAYDSRGNLIRSTDAEGNETSYAYDGRGNLIRQTDPSGVITEYSYDVMGNRLTESTTRTDASGQVHTLVTRHTYDSKGRRISTEHPDGSTTTTEYDPNDRPVRECDGLNRCTERVYDDRGNEVAVHYPDGTSITRVYDANDNLIEESDRAGRITQRDYDAADRLIRIRYPDGSEAQRVYDAAGRLVEEINPRGESTHHENDAAGQRIRTIDALGNVTRTDYNSRGQRTARTDALGRVTRYHHDPAGRLVETELPAVDGVTHSRHTEYDPLGRRIADTDEAGRVTRYAYDPQSRLIAVVQPDPATGNNPPLVNGDSPDSPDSPDSATLVTRYTWDEQGNKLSQTDALGRTTTWAYDNAGRVIRRTLPMGQMESFVYDAAGQRVSHTSLSGELTTYSYDNAGREITRTRADGSQVHTTWTDSGQIESRTDAQGTTEYQYDARDRLTRIDYPDGRHIAYTYDATGNRTRLTTANQQTDYGYDALNRLISVTDSQGTATYGYNAVGNRTTLTQANGTTVSYSHDGRHRLTGIEHRSPGDTLLHRETYTLDASGQRTALTETTPDGTRTVTWQYDALSRLTEESVSDSPRGDRITTWAHDATGNTLSRTTATGSESVTTSYHYDANDRLTSETRSDGTSTSYQWDNEGNLLEQTDHSGTTAYTWNSERRLTRVSGPAGQADYTYDADGIRQSVTRDGLTTRYLIDPNQPHAQVLEEINADTNQPDALYTLGNERLSQTRGTQTTWYHGDALGSTRLLTGDTGETTDQYWYTAYGELEHQASAAGSQDATENSFLYTGEQYDDLLDQYYLRARYYAPDTGRFTQMDTWLGRDQAPITLNKYLYGNANPVRFVDPSGHAATSAGMMTTVTVAATLATAVTVNHLNTAAPSYPGGNRDLEIGFAIIAAMSPTAGLNLINSASSARDKADEPVQLYRAVEHPEYLSIIECGCFSFPDYGYGVEPTSIKRFFLSASSATEFGYQWLKGHERLNTFYVVEATISRRLASVLDKNVGDPHIGPGLGVPFPMLPAFNAEVRKYGGVMSVGVY